MSENAKKMIENFLQKHHFLQTMCKTPMILVFLIMVAFFGIGALPIEAEINRYAVVTAVGVDLAQEEEDVYEVSVLLFVPVAQQSFTETYKVLSAKGKNVSEAMDFIGLHVGKEVGLSHVKFVVLSQDLLDDDVTNFLDYLIRNVNLSASTKMIATDAKAKDFLAASQKLDSESSIKVSEIITYNKEYIYAVDTSLETFLKRTYGPTRVGFVSLLSLKSSEGQGITASTSGQAQQENSSGGGQSGQGSQSQEIVNNGDTLVLKDGKKKLMLSGKDLSKISFVRGQWLIGSIEVENFSDEMFSNADLTYEIRDNQTNYVVTYENGIPVIYIDIGLGLKLAEVESEKEIPKENVEFLVISPKAVDAIEKTVKKNVTDGIEIMRDNQLDLADFYTLLYNNNKKAFLKFLDTLEDRDDYVNHIIFKVGVRVETK